MAETPAILLPGGVLPAGPAYGALIEALGDGIDARPKDLAVYASDEPPPGYELAAEVADLLAFADAAGFDDFHLAGHSAGGAVSIYTVVTAPERLRSVTLMEPAWAGNAWQTEEEAAVERGFGDIRTMDDPAEMMRRFVIAQIGPGTPPPELGTGPQPDWMARRPAGLRAIMGAFERVELDPGALERFESPVLYVYGGRSNPDLYTKRGERLANVFPDYEMELYAERHHFDPPHRTEPERLATSLRSLWARADADR